MDVPLLIIPVSKIVRRSEKALLESFHERLILATPVSRLSSIKN